jgi:hypothetical protein
MHPVDFGKWAVQCHEETKHYYDETLNNPYAFHLTMAVLVGEEFKHLLPESPFYLDGSAKQNWEDIVEPAIWGHDLMGDTRENYSSILRKSNYFTAEIIRAVTNYGRGRNREERMPDWIYKEIVDTKFAVFVKLCDRIANVRYSNMMRSRMAEVYRKEQEHFKKMLRHDLSLEPMWALLDEELNLKVAC